MGHIMNSILFALPFMDGRKGMPEKHYGLEYIY